MFSKTRLMFTFSQNFSKDEMPRRQATNNHGMTTNISYRNMEIRGCDTLFSVNCWLGKWSKKVIGEIQFNFQSL